MNEKAEIHDYVHNLLRENGDDAELVDHESLLVSGRLQSIDVVAIVLFLEQHFGIDFAKIGFDREQIDSIDAIYELYPNSTCQTMRRKPAAARQSKSKTSCAGTRACRMRL